MTSSDANPNSETTQFKTGLEAGGNGEPVPEQTDFACEDLRDRRLGDFRLLRRLGRGGMAEVYLAEQCSMSRHVALKILRPELVTDETHLKRFAQEARTAGGLNHPNIVQVFTVGETDGVHYIAQEYVQGINLAQYLQRKGPPDLRVALHIMKQAALALKSAGEAKIVHRDIKPENILITAKGTVKITDFGLARLTLTERVNLTQDGMTMGTPLYMSPEQINGRELDVRTDIYSFGVTCYHLLAGRPPFRGETAMSLAVKHVNEKPAPLERIRPDLPPALCRIIERMMAKAPNERYDSAAALLEDLKRVSDATGEANSPLTRSIRYVKEAVLPGGDSAQYSRSPGANLLRQIVVLVAGCLIVAAAAAGIGWMMRPPDPLSSEASEKNTEPQLGSVREQIVRAMTLDTEKTWLAVEDYFPHETNYVNLSRAELARLYVKSGRFDEASEIFQSFVVPSQTHPSLRARGYAGLAVIASVRHDHATSNRIITQDLLPLREHLDEKSRELVIEAILQNRAVLGDQVEPNLQRNFPPPPERPASNG